MDTPPSSEGGVSRGESRVAEGGAEPANESFHNIPDKKIPRHELLLLLRVEQENGRPLPIGPHSERCINLQILQWTGIMPARTIRMNPVDTVVEFAAEVPIGRCCTATSHDKDVGRNSCFHIVHNGQEGVHYGCVSP